MPQRAVQGAAAQVPGPADVAATDIISDRYLSFLVTELKPFIDANYRTLPGRADTSVMGSSMGGLISQYAMSRYPDVFGGAGCVSTHWPAGDGIALDDFAAHLPDPATHKYWFDFGTATLDRATSRTSGARTRSCARPVTSKDRTGSRRSSRAPSTPRRRGGSGWTSRWCSSSDTARRHTNARHAASPVDALPGPADAAGNRHGLRPVGADLGAELDPRHRVRPRPARDRPGVGRRPDGRHHRPAADRRDQRPGVVLGRPAPPLHHRRRRPGGVDDPGPALHRRDLAAPRLRRGDRRGDRGGARARPLDQHQLQPDALAHHRRHAGRHRAHARLHLDADGIGHVRRAGVCNRRGLRQLHPDLLCRRPGAAVLGAAGVPDRRAARAAGHGGSNRGRTAAAAPASPTCCT